MRLIGQGQLTLTKMNENLRALIKNYCFDEHLIQYMAISLFSTGM